LLAEFLLETVKGGDHFEDLGMKMKMVLKQIIKG
jgi:hypothetical protein